MKKKKPALKCHILYTWRRTTTFTFTVREQFEYDSVTDVAAVESCELPLMEEKQRCNITWIFLQVFNQTKRWHFRTVYYHHCSSRSDKTSVSVLIETVAITSVWSIGLLFCYYSTVSSRLPVVLWTIKVTVLTASLSSVYSVYILEKKIPVCCLFK